jgi:hypothetical protein
VGARARVSVTAVTFTGYSNTPTCLARRRRDASTNSFHFFGLDVADADAGSVSGSRPALPVSIAGAKTEAAHTMRPRLADIESAVDAVRAVGPSARPPATGGWWLAPTGRQLFFSPNRREKPPTASTASTAASRSTEEKRADTPPGVSALAANADSPITHSNHRILDRHTICTCASDPRGLTRRGHRWTAIHQARRPMHHCPPYFTHVHRHHEGYGHPFGLDHPPWSNMKKSVDRLQRSGSKVTFRVQPPLYTGAAGSRLVLV